ncbi:MAG: hypothetical protein OXI43_07395 [Candidatus Poribacteria bacterium]|nr:hypothetical protein [Candidatus Poribacteria bacterium]
MKTNLTSRLSLLALLVVLLTFSSHTVLAGRPYPTKPKVERKQTPAVVQAKQDAKQDAEADLNKRLWMGVGSACMFLPMLGGLASSLVTQSDSIDQAMGGMCIGMTVSFIGTPALIIYPPTPPSERLLGKTAEYIDVYTDVYKRRTRRLREKYAAAGCGIASGMMMIIAVITDD